MNNNKQKDRAVLERLLDYDPEMVLMINDITNILEEGDEILERAKALFAGEQVEEEKVSILTKQKKYAPEAHSRLINLVEEKDEDGSVTVVATFPATVGDEDIINLFNYPDGYRCECVHCLADRDCCGNRFAGSVRIHRDSHIAIATQSSWLNI